MAVMVRDAVRDDVLAIRAVAARAWPAAYEGLFPAGFIELVLERMYAPERVGEAIADPAGCFLVAEQEGVVVGYLHYVEGELKRLYVEPERIGAGIGRALLVELERRLPPGTEYVALVREGNERATGFYLRQGFEDAGRVDGLGRFLEGAGLEPPTGTERARDVLMRRRLGHVRS